MRKEGLPLKRLMSHESLTLVADALQARRRLRALRRGRRGQPRRPGRRTPGHRPARRRRGRRGGPRRGRHDHRPPRPRQGRQPAATPGVIVKGAPDVWVKLAKCCTPVPPRRRSSASSPRAAGSRCTARDCTNAASLPAQPERLLEVEWAPTGQSTFLVNIQVEALDRARLLSDITMVLSDAHVNILSANLTTTRDRVAKSRFTFEMADAKHLDNVLKAVRSRPRRLRRLPRHPVARARRLVGASAGTRPLAGRAGRASDRVETESGRLPRAERAGRVGRLT